MTPPFNQPIRGGAGQIWDRIVGLPLGRPALSAVLVAFVTTRVLLGLVILASSVIIPMRQGDFPYADPHNRVLDGLVRFDSWWYADIALHGYRPGSIATGEQGSTAFFPLYPLLVRGVTFITGNVFVAGVLVSHMALFVALLYLYALTRRTFDDETAARAVFYLAAAPAGVFFSAMYTESLFVALVCATLYYAGEQRWGRAAIVGALAAATRNTGFFLAAAVACEALQQQGVRLRPARWGLAALVAHVRRQAAVALASWRGLLAGAFVVLGLLGYMAFLANTVGDPLHFIHVQATWSRGGIAAQLDASPAPTAPQPGLIARTISDLVQAPSVRAGQPNVRLWLCLFMTMGAGALVMVTVYKLRPSHAIFAGLTFLAPLSSGSLYDMTRYSLMLIPCYMLLAHWGSRSWVDRCVLGIFLPLLAYIAIMFSHWYSVW